MPPRHNYAIIKPVLHPKLGMVWPNGYQLQTRDYRIETVLGQGGFGITYKALHRNLNQYFVIKTPNEYLKHEPDYPKYVDRFIKEGQRLAQLCANPHPHIVRVFDLFQEEENHCMVMDFIPGDNLWKKVQQRGAFSEAEAVRYFRQIGEALQVVHDAGLVHRDAHPGNIMFRGNSAVLIDFAIAGQIVRNDTSTHPLNEAFAPYEQRNGSCEPTVDIYTLSASLYYAVTGQRPANSFDRKIDDVELVPPKQWVPNLSDTVNQAIVRGMELDPNKRPQTMRDWLSMLPSPVAPNVSPRYQKLQELLAAGEWREADKETARVMLQVAGREKEGWLDEESINNFPCEDLRQIDRLWVQYSNGRFGFSVQKRIWQEVGGTVEYETERRLGDRVGWRQGGKWLRRNDLTYHTSAPLGHLPVGVCWVGGMVGWNVGGGFVWVWLGLLLSRPDL